ncbi:MAG: hypothetical protein KC464_17040 [Myxococcales bacterium]|nr:hypothetical protein [Myxococcales bacterium]
MLRFLGAAALATATACTIQPAAPATSSTAPTATTSEGAATPGDTAAASTAGDGAATTATASGQAYQLSYGWRAGDVHRYRYAETVEVEASMGGGGGMGADMTGGMGASMGGGMAGGISISIDATSDVALHVLDVADDGWAHVTLDLTAYDLSSGGQRLLALDALPRAARTAEAWISPRGEVVFANVVLVAFEGETMAVASTARAADRAAARARVSASVGDQELTIESEVDLQAGTSKAKGSSRSRKRRLAADATTLDVMPRQLLQMIVLPDDAIAGGSHVEVATPFGAASVTLTELDDQRLAYDTVIQSAMAGAYQMDAQIRTIVGHADGVATLAGASGHSTMDMDVGGVRQSVRHNFELTQLD